jgi:hypothetical protein
MTKPGNQPSSATRRTGGGRPPPGEHNPHDEQPRHHDPAEQGEQWQHSEHGEQALISKASRQPGGVQRSTLTEPGDDQSEQPADRAEPAVSATAGYIAPTPRATTVGRTDPPMKRATAAPRGDHLPI